MLRGSELSAITLGVQKFRINDITNILEGIGYVGKMQKNIISWVGYREDTKLEREILGLRLELDRIAVRESKVESYFRILNQQITKQFLLPEPGKQYNYVTEAD